MFKGIFTTIIVVAAAAGAFAQQPAAVRVGGAVDDFDGRVLAVKSEKLGDVKIHLTADATVFGVTEATIADIKPVRISASAPLRSRTGASGRFRLQYWRSRSVG